MINYYYDNGEVVGMKYNGTYYYFIKDLFGNIHQIKDSSHNLVAEYEYDAWGNNVITVNVNNIANVNPFRYRGYYMDTETGFYYLQTRYYDPVIRRFISPDNYELLPTLAEAGDLNLYTYCSNNPVMYTDPTGEIPLILSTIIWGAIIGGLIGGALEIGNQIIMHGGVNEWGKVGFAALGGFVAGGIAAIPVPGTGFLSYLGTFALGGIGSVAGGLISGSVSFNNPWSIALAFAIGGFANVAARGISDAILHKQATSISNMGRKAKSLAVQKLQGHASNMGSKALKGSMRNAFKDTSLATIKGLINNANPFFRYSIYASLNSSLLAGSSIFFM